MTTPAITMLPYNREGEIDYDSLDFDPDDPEKPDAMEQHPEQREVMNLLSSWFTEFDQRPDVFLDYDSFICYDRSNLNVRVSPDVYIAFGVDARAIRPDRLYLPWRVGKPPDWALEIASSTTGREDVDRKPGIYARIGVPEYWRFDSTGGHYHGEPLYGGILVEEVYQPVELTTAPDGVLKGYSPMLGLSLAWDEGWPRFYDHNTGRYLDNWQTERAARLEAESQRDAESAARREAEAEVRRLREQLRRRQQG